MPAAKAGARLPLVGSAVEVLAAPLVTSGEADQLATGIWQSRPSGKLADLAGQVAVIVAVRKRRWRFGQQRMRVFVWHTHFMPENERMDNERFS